MRAIVQRVDSASVTVDSNTVGTFSGPGLVCLIGVSVDDTIDVCAPMADKIWKLRIFSADELRARNITVNAETAEVSAADARLPIMIISQFTLYADTSRGRRPTWQQAARGEQAEPIINELTRALRDLGAHVETGKFGADMKITQTCDGPVTIMLEI